MNVKKGQEDRPTLTAVDKNAKNSHQKREHLIDVLQWWETAKAAAKVATNVNKMADIDEEVLKELVTASLAYMDEKYPR